MNPRALNSTVPAASVLPGDAVLHPNSGRPVRVESVFRFEDRVTISFRAAEALRLSRDARVRLGAIPRDS